MNPFQSRYDNCNTGTNAAKHNHLPEFPTHVDVELTSSCNFRCLMCPTGNLSLQRKPEFLSPALWKSIIDQCSLHDTGLRFIGWGEPTLHPALTQIIDTAHRAGLLTHINTNGSKLNRHMAHQLVRAGLSSIKFSFQGVDKESYAEMRSTDFFAGMIEAIKTMRAARGGSRTPYIAASTSVTYESTKQIERFRKLLEPLVDHLGIGHTTFDYMDFKAVRLKPDQLKLLERLKGMSTDKKHHPRPCPEVFDKLSIHADGSVVLCCNDYNGVVELGNVADTPIKEMWRHPKIEAYRKRLANNDYQAPLCTDCYDYMSLTKGEGDDALADNRAPEDSPVG